MKGALGKISGGRKECVTVNWRKDDFCYKVAGLCSTVGQKIQLLNSELG